MVPAWLHVTDDREPALDFGKFGRADADPKADQISSGERNVKHDQVKVLLFDGESDSKPAKALAQYLEKSQAAANERRQKEVGIVLLTAFDASTREVAAVSSGGADRICVRLNGVILSNVVEQVS